MSSIKRKRHADQLDLSDDQQPPSKKIKLNTKANDGNNEQLYQAKKEQIIKGYDDKIYNLQQQIEKEKKLKTDALNKLNKEFPGYLKKIQTNETIPKPDLCDISVHFESENQSATNNLIEEDYTAKWNAELRISYDQVFDGFSQFDVLISDKDLIKLKNTFPNLDVDKLDDPDIDPDANYFVLAKASFYVIQIGRLMNGGLDQLFTVLDAKCQELADLIEIIDINPNNEPGLFGNDKYGYDYGHRMNEGGGADNIILISRVEVNKNFKGKKYGRCLTQRIIDNFGNGMCRIVLKPFPLQWEHNPNNDNNEKKQQFDKDKKKVISVWESMGFRQLYDSSFWGRSEAFNNPMTIFE